MEDTVDVPVKWHKNFVARRGELLTQISSDYGGVSISLPRNGSSSETVKLSGAKECVAEAKQRILDIVADLEAQVSIECIIPHKHHRSVMGAKGMNVQEITKQFNVNIKFPDRPRQPSSSPTSEQVGAWCLPEYQYIITLYVVILVEIPRVNKYDLDLYIFNAIDFIFLFL